MKLFSRLEALVFFVLLGIYLMMLPKQVDGASHKIDPHSLNLSHIIKNPACDNRI